MSKVGLLVCWFGLSYSILSAFMVNTYKVDPVTILAKMINNLPLFFNIEGGQPLAPTDFAKNEIRIIKHNQ